MRYFRNRKKTVILTSTSGHCVRVGDDWTYVPDILIPQALANRCEEKTIEAVSEKSEEAEKDDSPFWVEPGGTKQDDEKDDKDGMTIQEAIDEINRLVESGETKYGKMDLLTKQGLPNTKVVSSLVGRSVKKDEVTAVLEAGDGE